MTKTPPPGPEIPSRRKPGVLTHRTHGLNLDAKESEGLARLGEVACAGHAHPSKNSSTTGKSPTVAIITGDHQAHLQVVPICVPESPVIFSCVELQRNNGKTMNIYLLDMLENRDFYYRNSANKIRSHVSALCALNFHANGASVLFRCELSCAAGHVIKFIFCFDGQATLSDVPSIIMSHVEIVTSHVCACRSAWCPLPTKEKSISRPFSFFLKNTNICIGCEGVTKPLCSNLTRVAWANSRRVSMPLPPGSQPPPTMRAISRNPSMTKHWFRSSPHVSKFKERQHSSSPTDQLGELVQAIKGSLEVKLPTIERWNAEQISRVRRKKIHLRESE